MQIVYGFDSISSDWPESTVCIGVFDGVHLGHQAVLREVVSKARMAGRPAVAITFDRHPMAVLSPENCPKSILSPTTNIEKIADEGIDATVVATFDAAFSRVSAEDFYVDYLLGRLRAAEIVVGHDFAFGHKREGTPNWLRKRISTHVHPALELDGERISSSAIRAAISEGRVSDASRMLGREFALAGVVVRGQRLGSELGVPTANLAPLFDQVLPSAGIYAGRARTTDGAFAAAISVGWRPSIPDAGFAIEAHLIDFTGGDLYGRSISLEFVERLRDEVSFESVTQLAAQMRIDIEDARKALIRHG
jgi:riboflavin kinase/FMN adenylyltransferase